VPDARWGGEHLLRPAPGLSPSADSCATLMFVLPYATYMVSFVVDEQPAS
jgi:hypothetical protein